MSQDTQFFQALIAKLDKARAHFPQYRAALFWILRDVSMAFPWAMCRLLIYSMLGASLQGAVLVGAIQYVRSLEDGTTLSIKGISIATQGGQNLSLAVLVLFLLLTLSAWILYLGKTVAAQLVADYQAHMLKRALALFGPVVPDQPAPENPSKAQQLITATIVQDAQKSVMLIRFLGNTLPSLVILVYAFPILLYLDLSMTLLLMTMVLVFVPFFYQDNLMAYESDLMAKRSGAGAKNTLNELMAEIKDYQYISSKQAQTINKAFRRGELKDRINFLAVFLRSLARTELWTNILLSLAVCLVIVLMVPGALAGDTPWSLLIGYLMFLRLGVNAFKSLMTFFTRFSRFYPYVLRYHNFVYSAEAKPNQNRKLVIACAAHGISEYAEPVIVDQPLRMALITRVPLSRYTFPYMVKLGTKADNGIFVSPRECFFIGQYGLPQKDGSIREMLGLPQEFTAEDLQQAMPEDLFTAIKSNLGLNLDRYQGAQKWTRLSLAHRIELGIVAALLSQARVVAIEASTLLHLDEDRQASLLGRLSEHKPLTVISYPEEELKNSSLGQRFQEQLWAVSGCTSNLLALGSPAWIQTQREEIGKLLTREEIRVKQDGDGDETGEEMAED